MIDRIKIQAFFKSFKFYYPVNPVYPVILSKKDFPVQSVITRHI